MKLRPIAGVLAACVVLAAITSCSDVFSPEVPTVAISLFVEPQLAVPSLTLRVAINGRRYEVQVDSSAGNKYVTVPVSGFGTLPIRIDLLNTPGDTLASAEFKQRFMADDFNDISGWVGVRPPLTICGGPDLTVSTRLADTIKLHVSHGGIPKDVIC